MLFFSHFSPFSVSFLILDRFGAYYSESAAVKSQVGGYCAES